MRGVNVARAVNQGEEVRVETSKLTEERHTFPGGELPGPANPVLSLVSRLHEAIEREEFLLYYQPTVDVDTRKVAGLEALIRWRSPHQGMVNPADFIPVLEETCMILEVGRWALRQASQDQARWADLTARIHSLEAQLKELRQAGRVAAIPAPSCLRLAKCVRSGPICAEAIVPLIAWQLTQLICWNSARPCCVF